MGRSFYGNDEDLTTKPGVNKEISTELQKKETPNGNVSFIEGMGVRSTPLLETQFNNIRSFFHEKLNIAEAEIGTQISAASNELRTFWDKGNSLIKDDRSKFLDVSIATVVAAAIVGRRPAPVRWLVIPAVLALTFRYTMPLTYEVSKERMLSWQKEQFPDFYSQQESLLQSSGDVILEIRKLQESMKLDLQETIHNTRKVLAESWNDDE